MHSEDDNVCRQCDEEFAQFEAENAALRSKLEHQQAEVERQRKEMLVWREQSQKGQRDLARANERVNAADDIIRRLRGWLPVQTDKTLSESQVKRITKLDQDSIAFLNPAPREDGS